VTVAHIAPAAKYLTYPLIVPGGTGVWIGVPVGGAGRAGWWRKIWLTSGKWIPPIVGPPVSRPFSLMVWNVGW